MYIKFRNMTTNLSRKVEMRRFRLRRNEDESGVSGTGYVAEGVKFSDGQTVINWLTDTRSIGIYHSIVEMIHIHGHGGKTIIEWVDEESPDGSGDGATEENNALTPIVAQMKPNKAEAPQDNDKQPVKNGKNSNRNKIQSSSASHKRTA